MPNFVGISGTPIIENGTAFFFSKGYKDGAASGGVVNGISIAESNESVMLIRLGRYLFYAVDVITLEDKYGFPLVIDGRYADNDHARYADA